VKAAQLE